MSITPEGRRRQSEAAHRTNRIKRERRAAAKAAEVESEDDGGYDDEDSVHENRLHLVEGLHRATGRNERKDYIAIALKAGLGLGAALAVYVAPRLIGTLGMTTRQRTMTGLEEYLAGV